MLTTMKAPRKMDLRIQTLLPQPKIFQTHLFPFKFSNSPNFPLPKTIKISCSSSKGKDKNTPLTDETLALELGLEIKKLNTNALQREEALNKSRELLFTEVCKFTGLKSDDLKKKWTKMNEDEKFGLAKGFVADWSAHFHPLSVKSVKQMVEEYVVLDDESNVSSGNLFPDFGKLLGFSGNAEE